MLVQPPATKRQFDDASMLASFRLTFWTGATAAIAPLHCAFIAPYCAFTATAPVPVATYAWYAVWH